MSEQEPTALEILDRAAWLVRLGWIRGRAFEMGPDGPRFCMLGALREAWIQGYHTSDGPALDTNLSADPYWEAHEAIERALPTPMLISEFNDKIAESVDDVVSVFERAKGLL